VAVIGTMFVGCHHHCLSGGGDVAVTWLPDVPLNR
jgi:hypothetical protein